MIKLISSSMATACVAKGAMHLACAAGLALFPYVHLVCCMSWVLQHFREEGSQRYPHQGSHQLQACPGWRTPWKWDCCQQQRESLHRKIYYSHYEESYSEVYSCPIDTLRGWTLLTKLALPLANKMPLTQVPKVLNIFCMTWPILRVQNACLFPLGTCVNSLLFVGEQCSPELQLGVCGRTVQSWTTARQSIPWPCRNNNVWGTNANRYAQKAESVIIHIDIIRTANILCKKCGHDTFPCPL